MAEYLVKKRVWKHYEHWGNRCRVAKWIEVGRVTAHRADEAIRLLLGDDSMLIEGEVWDVSRITSNIENSQARSAPTRFGGSRVVRRGISPGDKRSERA